MNHRAPGLRLQLTLRAERDHDVEIAVPAGTKLGAVAALLWAEARVPPGTRISLDGRPVEHHAELGRGGLRSGALLRLGTAAPRIAAARSVWQLHVIGGPDAGRRIGLSRGELTIGRGSEADVRIEDPDMSRSHARLSMRHDGIWLRDLSSSNGTLVDETPVRATELKLSPEDIITAGSSQLRLAPASDPPAATMDAEAGTRLVSRAARRPAPAPAEPVELPIAPADPTHPSVPWVTALLPAVLSIGLALALGNRQLLAFAMLGPLALLAGAVTDRLGWRRSRRKARLEHRSAAAAATERVRDRLAIEAAQRRREAPDPAAVAEIVGTPSCRLWERRPEDRDFLSLRVGTAVQPAQTGVLRGSEPLPPALLPRTPVQVDLASGPLAITGPPAATRASARWLVTQALALHAPRDLRVCALVEEGAADWRWLRWSPPERVTVAAAPAARRALGKALEQHKARRAAGAASRTRSDPGDASSAEPWLLVLIDLAESDADQVWLGSLLSDAAGLGITGIVVAHRPAQLPPACAQRARFTHHASGTLSLAAPGSPEVNEIRADAVRPDWAERLSRQLAPLREADCEGGVDLPAAADLGALLEQGGTLATAESGAWAAAALAASWQSRASCSTPIGVGRDGPVWLDLVRDGPHALIAGMTGSGKSELLRALIAGLTARQPPERLALVLIDYKGGSAFADCQGLPHVTGMATDLDPQLTDRVLVSLNAELRRREATLAA
ncbi:MAG: hypothetical protein JWO63_1733, partial [Frankiales bacterium]|nr:hypothetical protein [Frankiales bacterium]